MDFDSLPQDEKIVCLCSIFPEMDPVILNDLLEMYKTAESLFPIILQMTDEDYLSLAETLQTKAERIRKERAEEAAEQQRALEAKGSEDE